MDKKTGIDISLKKKQMANKQMKRLPISLTIRKMQMKTTMRYHLVPIRMDTINKIKVSVDGCINKTV